MPEDRYGFTTWRESFDAPVSSIIRGHVVFDLGSGPSVPLANIMLRLGANYIMAVDSERPSIQQHRLVSYLHTTFRDFRPTQPIEVAIVAWPQESRDILPLLVESEVIIYIGNTFDSTMCGCPAMWKYLSTREVLCHVPDRKNSLIIYGPHVQEREILREEAAGMDMETIHHWREYSWSARYEFAGATGHCGCRDTEAEAIQDAEAISLRYHGLAHVFVEKLEHV